VTRFPFHALTLSIKWQEGYPAHKRRVPLIPKCSALEQCGKKLRSNQLTEVHLKKAIKREMVDFHFNALMLFFRRKEVRKNTTQGIAEVS